MFDVRRRRGSVCEFELVFWSYMFGPPIIFKEITEFTELVEIAVKKSRADARATGKPLPVLRSFEFIGS